MKLQKMLQLTIKSCESRRNSFLFSFFSIENNEGAQLKIIFGIEYVQKIQKF